MFKTLAMRPSFGAILRRVALPFFIFAAVLLGFLVTSYTLLLPRLTEVNVAGQNRDTLQLQQHVHELTAAVTDLEEQRRQLVTPLRQGLYGTIKEEKFARFSAYDVFTQIESAAANLVADQKDVVHLSSLQYQPSEYVLILEGDIRNVGSRSMTVLAQYVDALKNLPAIADVEPPRFTRVFQETFGYHSPFVLHLRLL